MCGWVVRCLLGWGVMQTTSISFNMPSAHFKAMFTVIVYAST